MSLNDIHIYSYYLYYMTVHFPTFQHLFHHLLLILPLINEKAQLLLDFFDKLSIVYSNLNKSGPWIYQKGKIMFHMTFPYREMCDSEQYSIRAEISAEGILS